MGFYAMQITIKGVRSAHNSLQDKLDIVRWEYLAKTIREIVTGTDYSPLDIDVEGPTEG